MAEPTVKDQVETIGGACKPAGLPAAFEDTRVAFQRTQMVADRSRQNLVSALQAANLTNSSVDALINDIQRHVQGGAEGPVRYSDEAVAGEIAKNPRGAVALALSTERSTAEVATRLITGLNANVEKPVREIAQKLSDPAITGNAAKMQEVCGEVGRTAAATHKEAVVQNQLVNSLETELKAQEDARDWAAKKAAKQEAQGLPIPAPTGNPAQDRVFEGMRKAAGSDGILTANETTNLAPEDLASLIHATPQNQGKLLVELTAAVTPEKLAAAVKLISSPAQSPGLGTLMTSLSAMNPERAVAFFTAVQASDPALRTSPNQSRSIALLSTIQGPDAQRRFINELAKKGVDNCADVIFAFSQTEEPNLAATAPQKSVSLRLINMIQEPEAAQVSRKIVERIQSGQRRPR